MSASAEQIARLRRMVAEPTDATYSDATLAGYIEARALVDANGIEPLYYAGVVLGFVVNPIWVPTYDLNAAAADVWEEKAGIPAEDFDVDADGANLSRSQVYEHYMAQARYYRARRSAKTISMTAYYAGLTDSGV
jgi:hypothetical protein